MKTTDIRYTETFFRLVEVSPTLYETRNFLGISHLVKKLGRENAGNLKKKRRSRGLALYENRHFSGIAILVQGE